MNFGQGKVGAVREFHFRLRVGTLKGLIKEEKYTVCPSCVCSFYHLLLGDALLNIGRRRKQLYLKMSSAAKSLVTF